MTERYDWSKTDQKIVFKLVNFIDEKQENLMKKSYQIYFTSQTLTNVPLKF